MFTKIVQKWNAVKADWKEYQRLRRVAASAWHKLENVRKKITVLYNLEDEKKAKSCIRISLVSLPTLFGQDNSNRFEIVPCNSYCKHFKGNMDGENVVSCAQTHCSCYNNNCEYVAAAKELEAARENRRMFWRNKTK